MGERRERTQGVKIGETCPERLKGAEGLGRKAKVKADGESRGANGNPINQLINSANPFLRY